MWGGLMGVLFVNSPSTPACLIIRLLNDSMRWVEYDVWYIAGQSQPASILFCRSRIKVQGITHMLLKTRLSNSFSVKRFLLMKSQKKSYFLLGKVAYVKPTDFWNLNGCWHFWTASENPIQKLFAHSADFFKVIISNHMTNQYFD